MKAPRWGSRFEAAIWVPFLRAGVFDAQSLLTIPHGKLIRNLVKLSSAQLAVAERAVALWLSTVRHAGRRGMMQPGRTTVFKPAQLRRFERVVSTIDTAA